MSPCQAVTVERMFCRTLLVKFVGTCCGVCANVSLGPEAPTVHIGACVADNITHLACGEVIQISVPAYRSAAHNA